MLDAKLISILSDLSRTTLRQVQSLRGQIESKTEHLRLVKVRNAPQAREYIQNLEKSITDMQAKRDVKVKLLEDLQGYLLQGKVKLGVETPESPDTKLQKVLNIKFLVFLKSMHRELLGYGVKRFNSELQVDIMLLGKFLQFPEESMLKSVEYNRRAVMGVDPAQPGADKSVFGCQRCNTLFTDEKEASSHICF